MVKTNTFIEYIEEYVERLCAIFLQQLMTELTDVLKRKEKTTEERIIFFKEFNDLRIKS